MPIRQTFDFARQIFAGQRQEFAGPTGPGDSFLGGYRVDSDDTGTSPGGSEHGTEADHAAAEHQHDVILADGPAAGGVKADRKRLNQSHTAR